jgi:hypothetical protein
MKKTTLIIGSLLAILLLFGCIGGRTSSGATQKPGQTPPGIGDSDISVSQPANESEVLTEVEPVEADNTSTITPPAGNPPGIIDIGESIDVVQINDSDFITDVDIVEQ